MTGLSRTHLAWTASALALSIGAPAFAQDATRATATATSTAQQPSGNADTSINPGDIVVTAQRVEQRLQDVPISITVFNQEQINQRNIVNATDLATYTPSLSVNNRFGPEKSSFVIRGFVQDLATQPSVGVYFADVVAPRSGGSTTSGNGVGVGQLFDLQNVQVLKGPQGTLFGRNTTGGAVLLVPKKPTDRFEGYIEDSLGSYNMRRVQAVVNVPLADTFRVRLGVDRMSRDGYLINHGLGPNRLGDVNYWTARMSVVGELTPTLESYTMATWTKSHNNGITLRLLGCNRTPPASIAANATLACAQFDRQNARGDGPWDIENAEPDPTVQMETWQVINTTTWKATPTLTVKNIASYGEFRETTRMDLQGDFLLQPNGTLARALIRLNNTPNYNNASQSTYTDELQIQGRSSDDRLTWQAGAYFENSDPIGFTSQSTGIGLNCPNLQALQCNAAPGLFLGSAVGTVFTSTVSRPFQKTWFRDRGLYGQATYKITDQLSLTGGIRYTWDRMTHQYDGEAIAFPATNTPLYFCSNTVRVRYPAGTPSPVNPTLTFPVVTSPFGHDACAVTFSAKSSKPTWLLDIDYKPTPDTLIYAKWARGYRAGGATSANIYFETWQPEKVDTYEIGAKATLRGGSVNGYFNVAGFYNDFRNQQIQASLIRAATSPLLGGSAIINAGKSRIWGIEVDSALTLLNIFRLEGGYTYLNTKLLSLDPSRFVLTPEQQLVWSAVIPTATAGGPLAFSPKHRLSLTGTVMLPLDPSIGKISFGATYVHTASFIGNRATAPQFQVMPAQNLVNLQASWNDIVGYPVDLSFFMTNVGNKAYPMSVAPAWNSYGFETAVMNEPRMWGFRLRYRFGS
ncbi:MAG: TonB-dependent receptor [Novosphingobium sp.]|nr:TonB-dependent receptor [Novosphingobium sp.]